MTNRVGVHPRWAGAFAFWMGSDHYSLLQALRRDPFFLPVDRVTKVYSIEARSLIGLGSPTRYAIEYQSESRDCFITLEALPEELKHKDKIRTNPPGAALLFFRHCGKEPTAILLPFLIPFFIMASLFLLGAWNESVLHNKDFLAFFAKPGCDQGCVSQVLSIHSMVALLFFVQLALLFLPLALFFFQAPRYRSALNYRIIQSYSLTTVVVGGVLFLQLMAFFPFRQYGRFLEMGIGPQAERIVANLKTKNK